jgi:hypothetical protein
VKTGNAETGEPGPSVGRASAVAGVLGHGTCGTGRGRLISRPACLPGRRVIAAGPVSPTSGREGLYVETNAWPDDAGRFAMSEWPDERPAGHTAGRRSPASNPVTPVYGSTSRARSTADAGEPITGQLRSAPFRGEPAPVRSCWMCGIRLSADQMVADGGRACHDLRWYCRDTWACTERWTSRPATPAAIDPFREETPEAEGKQVTGAGATRPVPV